LNFEEIFLLLRCISSFELELHSASDSDRVYAWYLLSIDISIHLCLSFEVFFVF
jgi:hypothetical protein